MSTDTTPDGGPRIIGMHPSPETTEAILRLSQDNERLTATIAEQAGEIERLRDLLIFSIGYIESDIANDERAYAGYPKIIERNTRAARELLSSIAALAAQQEGK